MTAFKYKASAVRDGDVFWIENLEFFFIEDGDGLASVRVVAVLLRLVRCVPFCVMSCATWLRRAAS